MKQFTFTVIYTVDQDEKTGEIVMDHINNKLVNTVYFSHRFDLKVESNLKTQINDVRTELFQSELDECNQNLPEGTKPYIFDRPTTVPSVSFLAKQIVVPVEFYLELPDDADMTPDAKTRFIDVLTKATVSEIKILGSKMCNPKRKYTSWRDCAWNGKQSFFANIERLKRISRNPVRRGSLGEKFKEAVKKKTASK